jgi:hypothetical protein
MRARTRTVPEPTWAAGLRALRAALRCKAWSRSANRRCRQVVVPGRDVCHYHGGRAGPPLNNTNGVSSGRYMREDAIRAKANAAINRAIYGMIRNAVIGYEKQLPAAHVRAQHEALLGQITACQAVQEEARRSKAERLERHYGPVADAASTRKPSPSRKRKRARSSRRR